MVETAPPKNAFQAARKAMIDSQLRPSGVNAEFALKRMAAVAREDFVPDAARAAAYVDRALPLGDGRFIAAPVFYGMMLQEAAPRSGQHAIVIDGGSGYLPELVLPLVGSLAVLSPEEALEKPVRGKKADLMMIDGAVEQVPASLAKRLEDNALLLTGLAAQGGVTRLARGRKVGAGVALLPIMEMGIPRLSAFDRPKGWSF